MISVKRLQLAWAAILLATLAPGALAQSGESEKVVAVKAALSSAGVKPGQTVSAAVVLTIDKGWHINSNKPAQDFLVPAVISLKPPKDVTVGALAFPAAKKLKLSFSPDPLLVFEGKTTVRFPLTVAASAKPGTLTLKGTVSYQPCNETACFAPAEKPFTLSIPVVAATAAPPANQTVSPSGSKPAPTVFKPAAPAAPPAKAAPAAPIAAPTPAAGAAALKPSAEASTGAPQPAPAAKPAASAAPTKPHAPVVSAPTPQPAAAAASDNRWADALNRHGLLAFLALIFIGGLALNLTPCVYPMIAVTMSVFGARAGDARGKVLGKAIVYVLGMAVMYTALGVFAALSGSLFGGLLQSVGVQLFIAAFLAVLALGMFGLYTMQAPPALANALGGTDRGSTVGIFISGLVVGIFAAPCVGPVVLGLLALVGARHDLAFGAVSFFVLALGLGAPYIVLAMFTGLLSRMPRSGGWMEHVKHVFGLILFAVAARYATLALGRQWADFVTPAALAVIGWYLLTIPAEPRARAALATLGIVAGLAAGSIGTTAWQASHPSGATAAAAWPIYSDAALAESLQAGRPVVLDFSASWCAECRQLEHETFSDPAVQTALDGFTRLRVDLDGANKDQATDLQRKYRVAGLPAIVFLNASGQEIAMARVGGFLPPDQFLQKVALAK
ncbi:MAG TPA: cytochrome c biogenesis protein CcdA [Armatimonadota bacterium]|jgi:thiol:disulfide interchange protein DsbD